MTEEKSATAGPEPASTGEPEAPGNDRKKKLRQLAIPLLVGVCAGLVMHSMQSEKEKQHLRQKRQQPASALDLREGRAKAGYLLLQRMGVAGETLGGLRDEVCTYRRQRESLLASVFRGTTTAPTALGQLRDLQGRLARKAGPIVRSAMGRMATAAGDVWLMAELIDCPQEEPRRSTGKTRPAPGGAAADAGGKAPDSGENKDRQR